MPVIKSAKKKLRVDRKRELAGKKIKNALIMAIKKAKKVASEKNIKEAMSIVDKSAKKNIIHKNKASRIKSRLSKLLTRKKTPAKSESPKVKSKKPKTSGSK